MKRLFACCALLILVLAAPASARHVSVADRLSSVLDDADASGLVVLLPAKADLDYSGARKIYADGKGTPGRYTLSLSATAGCDGSACFLAEFTGRKGAKLGHATNVALASGFRGYYRPISCGASCAPSSISWIRKGVRYEIEAKALGGKTAFISMANSAIRAGDRRR